MTIFTNLLSPKHETCHGLRKTCLFFVACYIFVLEIGGTTAPVTSWLHPW